MKKFFLLSMIALMVVKNLHAQIKMSAEDSLRFEEFKREQQVIQKASEADYKIMLQQLHIDSVRRGPSGNPKDANAANSDESKVPPYALPDALTLKNGEKVTNANTWWQKRRPEIVEDFDKEIYGRVPENVPTVKGKLFVQLIQLLVT